METNQTRQAMVISSVSKNDETGIKILEKFLQSIEEWLQYMVTDWADISKGRNVLVFICDFINI